MIQIIVLRFLEKTAISNAGRVPSNGFVVKRVEEPFMFGSYARDKRSHQISHVLYKKHSI